MLCFLILDSIYLVFDSRNDDLKFGCFYKNNYIIYKSKYKKVGVLPMRIRCTAHYVLIIIVYRWCLILRYYVHSREMCSDPQWHLHGIFW